MEPTGSVLSTSPGPAQPGLRIAVLEDEPTQAKLLAHWLEDAGHVCHLFATGAALVRSLGRESYDLLLIDWQVPEMTGLDVLRWVRQTLKSAVAIIFVTAQDAEEAIVQVLNEGADDYLVKPVRQRELLARVGALWRRARGAESAHEVLSVAPYRLDTTARLVEIDGKMVELTDKEFDLSVFLFRALGRVVSRGHILECVWGRNSGVVTRTVDTHVSRLRNKLEIGPRNGLRLSSVYSYGYRLERVGD